MKNTRKKMLLSSVAMLLVALVALGSATYAWFTANPNADASGISMKTTAAAGLVIQTDTDKTEWKHSAILNNGLNTFNATPASMNTSDPSEFWTVIAAKSNEYTAKSGETMTTVSAGRASTDGVYAENIYCRLSDGSDATANSGKEVKITGVSLTGATGATMAGCIRVAIAKGTTLLGTWALSGKEPHGTLTGSNQTTGSLTVDTAAASGLDVATGLTGLSANASDNSKYITVYVYLDGQDGKCDSDRVGTVNAAEIISSVKVDLTLA